MKHLVLIDGNALLHRAYHATPPFTTSLGELVNAVYGFSSMLLRTLNELKPDFLAIAWDEKGKRLLLTGKWWPEMHEVKLVKK